MDIIATITSVTYKPYLCSKLDVVPLADFRAALDKKSSFLLALDDQNLLAISTWVSPKRTRSYPYARVYNTLSHTGKKVTIIPIYKDEGADGDRDFLQWDTISLMSLLNVYVILGYYSSAEKNASYSNKITNQKFAIEPIQRQIFELRSFQSDALHWNLLQIDNICEVAAESFEAYRRISRATQVSLHNEASAQRKISEISSSADIFKRSSRVHARAAQNRETLTVQPKELVNQDEKSTITITNYIGGEYNFTVDEAWIDNSLLYLAECKHSSKNVLPSNDDIKDGLIKMVLYSNLAEVLMEDQVVNHMPILRLTSSARINDSFRLSDTVRLLEREAEVNGFSVLYE